jgi:holo-[acyl-carrier protein] synthase
MIYGIGTDIVSVERIKKSLKNKNLLNRLFSNEEISKCNKLNNPNNCYAKRFAAKEAFAKALGTGISKFINFN